MIHKRPIRRAAVATLMALGAALMLLSPSVRLGLLAFALGVVLELAGLVLERRQPPVIEPRPSGSRQKLE